MQICTHTHTILALTLNSLIVLQSFLYLGLIGWIVLLKWSQISMYFFMQHSSPKLLKYIHSLSWTSVYLIVRAIIPSVNHVTTMQYRNHEDTGQEDNVHIEHKNWGKCDQNVCQSLEQLMKVLKTNNIQRTAVPKTETMNLFSGHRFTKTGQLKTGEVARSEEIWISTGVRK